MRIAIITESFPPDVNGVSHCVVRVAENLLRKGHHPLVIAPESALDTTDADSQLPYPVERVPSVPVPGYPTFRLGLPTPKWGGSASTSSVSQMVSFLQTAIAAKANGIATTVINATGRNLAVVVNQAVEQGKFGAPAAAAARRAAAQGQNPTCRKASRSSRSCAK